MKKTYIIASTCILILGGVYFVQMYNKDNEYDDIYIEENSIVEETKTEIDTIKVHIAGEVLNEGIYEIEAGSRIDDVIKIAGNIKENADLTNINLAYELSDGEKIYIPSIFDEESEYNLSSDNKKSSSKININKANVEELQKINGIGESLANRIVNYRKENGKFSTIEELKNVSGIGDKKYESIKEYVVIKWNLPKKLDIYNIA